MEARLTREREAAAEDQAAALELHSISKRFGSQTALREVDLKLREGEVHALLGQNGSGKSTLIKILAGFHQPDGAGRAWNFGRPVQLGSATEAHAAGMRFVHQDLALVPDLDVVDNMALGERYVGRRWLSAARERRAAQGVLDGLGIAIDSRRMVRDLSPAERTLVAVARALRSGVAAGSILVLDEVSATLPEGEARLVFRLVEQVREQGGTVLYVTHRLEEVFAIADRVTVLRDGRRVATKDVTDLDQGRLIELIVGRPVDELYPSPPKPRTDVVLRARALGGEVARGVDLELHRGEIVGIAGLTGSGREELPYLMFGALPWTGGEVAVGGRTFRRLTPAQAIRAGLALIPADRAEQAATPTLSVRENVALPRLKAGRARWINTDAERREVEDWLERMGVVPLDAEAPLAVLSGGNQQKVILARWFRSRASVLLLDEPTQGIDVGSKAGIYRHLIRGAREGMSVLLASSDHDELAAVCDRVLVMSAGCVAADLEGEALTADALSHRALGGTGTRG